MSPTQSPAPCSGFLVPEGTPRPVIDKLSSDPIAVLGLPIKTAGVKLE